MTTASAEAPTGSALAWKLGAVAAGRLRRTQVTVLRTLATAA
jgi:hypothetical protein